MPELPEVETIVRELAKKLSGEKLEGIDIFDKKISVPRIKLPAKVSGVDRHGKFIVIHLPEGELLIHLRMSGRLRFMEKNAAAPQRWERARFRFSRGRTIGFFDPRRFGVVEYVKGAMPELGVNPLGPGFTAAGFAEIVRSASRPIKNLLLDQKKISGLGNIYADESLWYSKINPLKKSDSLKPKETELLRKSIVKVLRSAIEKGGFTMRDYRKTGGEPGSYQNFRKVYKREGLLCYRCGSKIVRIKIGGRSARFCPKCQKRTPNISS